MATFAQQLPAWCGPDGFPLSWRHYLYGLRYLGRAHLREQLQQAEALRMANAVQADYTAWHRDTTRAVGPGE